MPTSDYHLNEDGRRESTNPQNKPVNEDENDAYAEDSPLTWIFGNHPKTKILAVLCSRPYTDFNKRDIARAAGMSPSTVYNSSHITDLMEMGLVVENREVGGHSMYQINLDNKIAVGIIELEEETARQGHENPEFTPPE